MPINKETIISVFDDKLTLMQWLKTINKALEDAVLTGVEITKKGNATLSFKFTFEDGTYLESNDLVLQQGESVENAYIQNGHLYLTLTNGTNLDAGNVKPVSSFSINTSQHLIVNYGDGTSQDLGAIFNGNVNISGTLTANLIDGVKVTGNEIVEKMNGYNFTRQTNELNWNGVYASICKNGNKLSLVIFGNFTYDGTNDNNATIGYFTIPNDVGTKLYPYDFVGQTQNNLDNKTIQMFNNLVTFKSVPAQLRKNSNTQLLVVLRYLNNSDLVVGETYMFRYEITLLLSDNLLGA